MMSSPWVMMAVIAAAGLVSSFVTAAIGIGGGLIVMPILALAYPPREIVALTAPMFMANAIVTLWLYRKTFGTRRGYLSIPGILVGIGVGARVLAVMPAAGLRILIGLIVFGFLVVELIWRRQSHDSSGLPLWTGLPLSLLSGGVSAVSNIGGTIISMYLLEPGVAPAMFVGTISFLYVIMTGVKLLVFGGMGIVSWATIWPALPSLVTIVLGAKVGKGLNGRISATGFRWTVVSVMGVSAFFLLLRGQLLGATS